MKSKKYRNKLPIPGKKVEKKRLRFGKTNYINYVFCANILLIYRVVDPYHFDQDPEREKADPDPTLDPAPT